MPKHAHTRQGSIWDVLAAGSARSTESIKATFSRMYYLLEDDSPYLDPYKKKGNGINRLRPILPNESVTSLDERSIRVLYEVKSMIEHALDKVDVANDHHLKLMSWNQRINHAIKLSLDKAHDQLMFNIALQLKEQKAWAERLYREKRIEQELKRWAEEYYEEELANLNEREQMIKDLNQFKQNLAEKYKALAAQEKELEEQLARIRLAKEASLHHHASSLAADTKNWTSPDGTQPFKDLSDDEVTEIMKEIIKDEYESNKELYDEYATLDAEEQHLDEELDLLSRTQSALVKGKGEPITHHADVRNGTALNRARIMELREQKEAIIQRREYLNNAINANDSQRADRIKQCLAKEGINMSDAGATAYTAQYKDKIISAANDRAKHSCLEATAEKDLSKVKEQKQGIANVFSDVDKALTEHFEAADEVLIDLRNKAEALTQQTIEAKQEVAVQIKEKSAIVESETREVKEEAAIVSTEILASITATEQSFQELKSESAMLEDDLDSLFEDQPSETPKMN